MTFTKTPCASTQALLIRELLTLLPYRPTDGHLDHSLYRTSHMLTPCKNNHPRPNADQKGSEQVVVNDVGHHHHHHHHLER